MYLLLGVVLPLNLGRPIGPDNRSPCPPARAGHRRADSFSSERRTNPAKRAWSGERELWWFDSQFTITVDRYPTGTPKREKTRVQITTTATLRIVPSTLKFHFFGWVFDSSSVNALFTSANVLDDETRWHRNARWNFVQKWNVHIYVHNPKRWCHSCMVVTVVLKTYTLYF